MPQNVTPVDVWTDPIVEMADSDPADATYVRTAIQALANRIEHLRAPRALNRIVAAVDYTVIVEAGWVWPSNFGYLQTQADAATLLLPMHVVTGETLVGCKIRVKPGAVRAGGNRMRASLVHLTNGFASGSATLAALAISSPDSGTTIRWDAGTTAFQNMTLALVTPQVVTDEDSYYVVLDGGNTGSTQIDEVRDTLVQLITKDLSA